MKYFSFGKGSKNLVLLPGVGLRSITLAPELVVDYYSPFAEDYTIYVLDTREAMPADYTIEEMAEDAYELLQKIGVKKACFNGCSMGGMILTTLITKHPEIIEKAVLSSTTHHVEGKAKDVIGSWCELTKAGDLKQLAEQSCQEVYTKEYYDKYYDALMDYHLGANEEECDKFIAQLEAILKFYNKDFENIKEAWAQAGKEPLDMGQKVMAIGAKGDACLPYTNSLDMAQYTGCGCYIYEGSSHAVYDEAPDFLDRIKHFLSSKLLDRK